MDKNEIRLIEWGGTVGGLMGLAIVGFTAPIWVMGLLLACMGLVLLTIANIAVLLRGDHDT